MRYIDFDDQRDERLRFARMDAHHPARLRVSPERRDPASDEDRYEIEEFSGGEYRPAGSVRWAAEQGRWAGRGWWVTFGPDGSPTPGRRRAEWVHAVSDYRYLRSYATQDEALTLHHARFH